MATVPLPTNDEFERIESTPEFERISREEFIEDVFVPGYEPGQHVAIMGPTRSGKTTLAYELLDRIASPDLPAYVLVMKPRDDVVVDWSKLAGFRKTERWPPVFQRAYKKKGGGFGKKQRGWVVWPKHGLRDIRQDNAMLKREFSRVLTECYRKGKRIVFADEIVGLVDLGLKDELEAIWMRGGSMECGLWAASQRPFNAPVIMYGSSAHLLIFKDGDRRSIERYRDIGGLDEETQARIPTVIAGLKKHEFLYIGRFMGEDEVSPALAIVEAN
jgi:energy-coupling factor transporter ATP-binding protein EcfA2